MVDATKAPPGHFTILYFAAAVSYTNRQHDFFEAPMLATQLWAALEKRYAGFEKKVLESAALTVNLDYVDLGDEAKKGEAGLVIQERDEVAIIPPVSSG